MCHSFIFIKGGPENVKQKLMRANRPGSYSQQTEHLERPIEFNKRKENKANSVSGASSTKGSSKTTKIKSVGTKLRSSSLDEVQSTGRKIRDDASMSSQSPSKLSLSSRSSNEDSDSDT